MTKVVEVIDREITKIALRNLVGAGMSKNTPWIAMDDKFQFEHHPLNLDIPMYSWSNEQRSRRKIYLLPSPYGTDPSVESMSKVVLWCIQYINGTTNDMYFRINQCEVGPGYPKDGRPAGSWTMYDYLFEFSHGPSVFLAGGCNNHSGQSSYGATQLHAVFRFASDLLRVPLMVQKIPQQDWSQLKDGMWKEIRRQETERLN